MEELNVISLIIRGLNSEGVLKIRYATYLFFLIVSVICVEARSTPNPVQDIWQDESIPDSIRFGALENYFNLNVNSEPDKALEAAEFHYELAEKKECTSEKVRALNNKAKSLSKLGRFEEALKELKTLVDFSLAQKDSITLAEGYYLIGRIFHYQSKYGLAVENLLESLSLYQEQKIDAAQSSVFNALGTVYSEVNNFELALDYYTKGSQLARVLDQKDVLNIILINIGFVEYEKGNYSKAIALSRRAGNSFELNNFMVRLADSHYLMAQSYQAINELDSALFCINECLDINIDIGNIQQIIPTKLLYANILFDLDKRDEATKVVQELLPILNTSFGYKYHRDSYHLLYKSYKDQGRLPLALSMHEKYALYNDSLLVEEEGLALTRQALQSNHEIELLNSQLENEKIQSRLRLSQFKRTVGIILVSASLIFLTVLYARSNMLRQRREKEVLLAELKELKNKGTNTVQLVASKFQLIRDKIEMSIGKKINDTDWNVLNILLDDPVISNKDIAAKAYLTVDGIGSCLRRMYIAFDIKESKYKKISLIMKAIKLSNLIVEDKVLDDEISK